MGRPAKPTALKVVGGNAGKRALNKNEPDPDYLQDLTPPAHLSTAASAVWNDLAPKLRQARVLTQLDAVALEMMCNAVSMYRLAVANAGEKPLARSAETGTVSLSPWMIAQSMAFKQATAIMAQFGMTPAARSKVCINPQGDLFGPDNKNPTAKYF